MLPKTTDEIREAAEACVGFTFKDAEEIGSSDVSGCARDVAARLGLDADKLTLGELSVLRIAVRDAIRLMNARRAD